MKVFIGAVHINEWCPKCGSQMLAYKGCKYCWHIASCGYRVHLDMTHIVTQEG